jgi:hypothetical protein
MILIPYRPRTTGTESTHPKVESRSSSGTVTALHHDHAQGIIHERHELSDIAILARHLQNSATVRTFILGQVLLGYGLVGMRKHA